MKASDLRIGNLVEQGEVRGIINFRVFVGDEAIHISNIKPIPLTEEILLKCGFENNYDVLYFYLDNDNYSLCYNPKGFFISTFDDDEQISSINVPDFKHLHQLQNLYYAITNQELEIKL